MRTSALLTVVRLLKRLRVPQTHREGVTLVFKKPLLDDSILTVKLWCSCSWGNLVFGFSAGSSGAS